MNSHILLMCRYKNKFQKILSLAQSPCGVREGEVLPFFKPLGICGDCLRTCLLHLEGSLCSAPTGTGVLDLPGEAHVAWPAGGAAGCSILSELSSCVRSAVNL